MFWNIDEHIMNNEYENKEIYIIQYPNVKELYYSQGEIKSIDNYNIKHSVSTYKFSSGSTILIQSKYKFKIIGVYKKRCIKGKII